MTGPVGAAEGKESSAARIVGRGIVGCRDFQRGFVAARRETGLDACPSMAYRCGVVIVETPIFTRQVTEQLTELEYRELQVMLVTNPGLGEIIKGSGGLRKVRWMLTGRGKRGGARII